MEINYSC